jgi:hypothetical protein
MARLRRGGARTSATIRSSPGYRGGMSDNTQPSSSDDASREPDRSPHESSAESSAESLAVSSAESSPESTAAPRDRSGSRGIRSMWMATGVSIFGTGLIFTIAMPDNFVLGITFLGVGVVFFSLAGSKRAPGDGPGTTG